MGFFGKKNRKFFQFGKMRKYDKRVFFREKQVFIFLKAFFKKKDGAKYASGSRPSCSDNQSTLSVEVYIYQT